LQMEPLALIAAEAKDDVIKFMVIESGSTSKLVATLKKDEPVSLMGPTGIRNKIAHEHETILIAGTQMSIPIVLSYGKALKQNGNRVIYVADMNSADEVYCQTELEAATDVVIWLSKDKSLVVPQRITDYSSDADTVTALHAYANGLLNDKQPLIPLSDVDRVFLIGGSRYLKSFQAARETTLKDIFIKNPKISGSVYSTMQCMLKGVCAQCLQWQVDPETGKRTKAVFACSWPDQPLELIDFDNIDDRLVQNQLQETITNLWVDYIFEHHAIDRV
jgi:NAD(P)H-flavin reductase